MVPRHPAYLAASECHRTGSRRCAPSLSHAQLFLNVSYLLCVRRRASVVRKAPGCGAGASSRAASESGPFKCHWPSQSDGAPQWPHVQPSPPHVQPHRHMCRRHRPPIATPQPCCRWTIPSERCNTRRMQQAPFERALPTPSCAPLHTPRHPSAASAWQTAPQQCPER